MAAAVAQILQDGERLHLQHGPIDLIIGIDGSDHVVRLAMDAARRRFETILQELVDELSMLRKPVLVSNAEMSFSGSTAKRMKNAVAPHADEQFVTPMAAVAGAVADEILAQIVNAVVADGREADLHRAYVNNGGDIAFHLDKSSSYSILLAGLDGNSLGKSVISGSDPVRGVATSGREGRSLSRGIADSVTVLAKTAAAADAAATLIANNVMINGHPEIEMAPANDLDPDSDLGTLLVVTQCGDLSNEDTSTALQHGEQAARAMQSKGLIEAAALFLNGQSRLVSGQNENLKAIGDVKIYA